MRVVLPFGAERCEVESVDVEAVHVEMLQHAGTSARVEVQLFTDLDAAAAVPLTVAMSYSSTMHIGEGRGSITSMSPPRSVTKAR
jgi:hypothetical protein